MIQSNQQSFHTVINNKSQFTFIEDSPKQADIQLLLKFDIRESSALELSSQDILNKSINLTNNISDISAINLHYQNNQLECSVCLQNQIDCLSSPRSNNQELKVVNDKIEKLKLQQDKLQHQLEIFHNAISASSTNSAHLIKQIINSNKFYKKNCPHNIDQSPFNYIKPASVVQSSQLNKLPQPQPQLQQITIQQLPKQTKPQNINQPMIQHFNIRPNKNKSIQEIKANMIYKQASFINQYVVFNDQQNEYKVEVKKGKQEIIIQVVNYQRGQTNFIHVGSIKRQGQPQQMAQILTFPINKFVPKQFAITLQILLLIFEPHTPKQSENVIKVQQIRTISIPLPLSYLIEPRFLLSSLSKETSLKMRSKLHTYQILISYHVDYNFYKRLLQCQWMSGNWLNLKELKQIKQIKDDFSLSFHVGTLTKQCQQSIDMIQYLCFMLSI